MLNVNTLYHLMTNLEQCVLNGVDYFFFLSWNMWLLPQACPNADEVQVM